MKRTTIGSVMRGICYGFAALLFTASCANDDVAQENKQKKDNIPAGTTVFTGTSQTETTTRTAILNHTKGSDASVNWEIIKYRIKFGTDWGERYNPKCQRSQG